MKYDNPSQIIPIFYTQNDYVSWKAIVKGRIISIGEREDTAKQELTRTLQPKTKITVRLYNTEGIHKGTTLYVINSSNLIVSRFTVENIFRSQSFGDMLVGYGFFRLSTIGDRVVQRFEGAYPEFAKIHKARGDYYKNTGEFGNAIKEYNQAIILDAHYPEAHIELGKIYFNDNVLQFAFNEFEHAYKNKERIIDKQDHFELLLYMTKTRYIEAYETNIPLKLKEQYINDGIKYAKEALEIIPDSVEILYMLGIMYYKKVDPDDVAAKKTFEKVIELDPTHIGAYIALSELYLKHKNHSKANYYSQKALTIDPANERARFLYRMTKGK
ncbi:MAG: tetratricopeptide repeat protein [Spirochaetes bacterium]|nr:tetratricopeptide repeat protein [Spirochaetota bacterium]